MRSLDLSPDGRMLTQSVERWCSLLFSTDGEMVTRRFSRRAWTGLAELGVFELAADEGQTLQLTGVMEALGRAGFAGPLQQSVIASRLLADPARQAVVDGHSVPTVVGESGLAPWGAVADLVVKIEHGDAYLASGIGSVRPVETLARQEWARVELSGLRPLGAAAAAVAAGEISLAAFLVGSASRMVQLGADYARHRRQFGRPIGAFQAVSHPLADAYVATVASRLVARNAAVHLDEGHPAASALAGAARLSASRAARQAAYVSHQVFGAMGCVEGTLLSALSRHALELTGAPPGVAHAQSSVWAEITSSAGM